MQGEKNMTKAQLEKELTRIACANIYGLEDRKDLKSKHNDEDDFFEASVWSLEDALKAAYELGRNSR